MSEFKISCDLNCNKNEMDKCSCYIDEPQEKIEELKMCNCIEDDVCPNCVDSKMDDLYNSMINGTAGRNIIDMQIDIKEYLISIITTPEFVKNTQDEIKALKILRERQQTD